MSFINENGYCKKRKCAIGSHEYLLEKTCVLKSVENKWENISPVTETLLKIKSPILDVNRWLLDVSSVPVPVPAVGGREEKFYSSSP